MTVKELIDILSKFDQETLVLIEEYKFLWSGDPNDTDMSDYFPCENVIIEKYEYFVSWDKDDVRLKDKRRTKSGDIVPAIIFRNR